MGLIVAHKQDHFPQSSRYKLRYHRVEYKSGCDCWNWVSKASPAHSLAE